MGHASWARTPDVPPKADRRDSRCGPGRIPDRTAPAVPIHTTMNLRNLASAIVLGSILPLALWGENAGQKTRAGSDNTRAGSEQRAAGSSQAAQQNTRVDRDTDSRRTQAEGERIPVSSEPWGTSAASTTVTTLGGIYRLNPELLDQRVTANTMIGKEVVDRDGKVVGTIKDLGLTSVLPLHLQSMTDPRTDRRVTAPGIRPPTQGEPETTPAETNPMSGANPMQPGGTADLNVLVQVSGDFGLEEDLLVIPASQLWRVEGNQERYRIVLTEAEIKNIASPYGTTTAPAE